jgi:hypothetical protein
MNKREERGEISKSSFRPYLVQSRRVSNVPFKAAATSRMFLKWVERYSPLDVETIELQCS